MKDSRLHLVVLPLLVLSSACRELPSTPDDLQPDATVEKDAGGPLPDGGKATMPDAGLSAPIVRVLVSLDGMPVSGAIVMQGGTTTYHQTLADGSAEVELERGVPGTPWIVASHPRARIGAEELGPETTSVEISLVSFDASDNPEYRFSDPGEPERRNTTGQCGHCHQTINDSWFASPHRTSAKNERVHDLYAGSAAALSTEAACETAGGRWRAGRAPGTGRSAMRCYVGSGTLQELNPACRNGACDTAATKHGDCANCHAPGIDGQLGGRDLLEATGVSFDYGVHCDVCHSVENVDLDAPAGVGARLNIVRPSEPGSRSLGAGGLLPLTFGPSHDSPNPRMGSVQRAHFRDATLCAGCHEYDQPVLNESVSIDRGRWPQGSLPIHSTYSEWKNNTFGEKVPCQQCHMPPDPTVLNGGDLQRFPDAQIGLIGGFVRPPGSVRQHSWVGPRSLESRMLQLAATVALSPAVSADRLTVTARTKNIGAGHAIPTGEPMRQMVLRVFAECGGEALEPIGGDTVPGFAGFLERRSAGEDWTQWVAAQPGQVVRVVRRQGGWHDYVGFGPFGDGRFDAEQKGLPVEQYVGASTIVAVRGGVAEFDEPLPDGDIAYLGVPDLLPGTGDSVPPFAGAPGFAFARVLADANGALAVPHFAATDVVTDNRLRPGASWTTSHEFRSSCPTPTVTARLYYLPAPFHVSEHYHWNARLTLMTEVSK